MSALASGLSSPPFIPSLAKWSMTTGVLGARATCAAIAGKASGSARRHMARFSSAPHSHIACMPIESAHISAFFRLA